MGDESCTRPKFCAEPPPKLCGCVRSTPCFASHSQISKFEITVTPVRLAIFAASLT